MTKKLSKGDLAYNAVVDAINEQDKILIDALNERNKLSMAAETLCPVGLFKQHDIVGK